MRAGNARQVSFAMALTYVESKRLMLANNVRIIGEEVRPRRARESIEHFGARPFNQVAHLEPASPSRSRVVLRIRIDLPPGLLEDGRKSPSAGLKCAHVRA